MQRLLLIPLLVDLWLLSAPMDPRDQLGDTAMLLGEILGRGISALRKTGTLAGCSCKQL